MPAPWGGVIAVPVEFAHSTLPKCNKKKLDLFSGDQPVSTSTQPSFFSTQIYEISSLVYSFKFHSVDPANHNRGIAPHRRHGHGLRRGKNIHIH
jgi:hypothetical protein